MVRFTEKSFTIEVEAAGNPVSEWLETHDGLINLLQCQDSEQLSNNFHVLELIREMMPDYETARKMTK